MNFFVNRQDKKRIFIGLEIPEDIRLFYYAILNRLVKTHACIKPVQPQNIHLTLQFLGDISNENIRKIITGLKKALYYTQAFSFSTEDVLKGFPNSRSSKIIYVAIKDGREIIVAISKKIKETVSFLSLQEKNKKFIPHITLARTKTSINLENNQIKIRLKKFENISCEKIVIFESILSKNGAEYFKVDEIYLKT